MMGILDRVPNPVREKMGLLIVTALGLFLALQYNLVIGEIFETYLPSGEALWAKVLYVIVLTFIIVILVIFIERVFTKRR